MAYSYATDALQQLLQLRSNGGSITSFARRVSTIANGLPYYFVEVTSQNGSQYAIQAYGDKATKLYDEVMKITGNLPILGGRTKKM
ncbi:MAG: hypothetical protein WBP84_11435 [Nitrososphaeraceae archaeon]